MIDFETVLCLRQPELKKVLREELLEMGYLPTSRKGFLYAPGEIPVLLVAHLDTVHYEPPSIICYSKDGRYMMSPQGIGGDDRAGVYMILQILKQVNCHVLFCEDEESGGHGAKAFTKSGIKISVNYIIELDRKGDNDAVYYGCDNMSFREFIHGFEFQEAVGSFSDISILAPHLKTAAVNLSTGYYNAHRNHEFIDTQVMANNVERVIEMVMTPTDHYKYQSKFTKKTQFPWHSSLFDTQITDMSRDSAERKLLMWLPGDTRLLAGTHELRSSQRYLIDRSGIVYAYIDYLNAAVESDILMACDINGYEVQFRYSNAEHIPVISYEEAMSRLKDATVVA
jgi:hypothetical protein